MELLQGGCLWMIILPMICDNTCKSILNTLHLVLTETWQTCKQRVKIVKTTGSQGICNKDSHILQVFLASSEIEKSVLNHTPRFFDNLNRMEKTSKNIRSKMTREFFTLSLGIKNNKFNFIRVESQFTKSHLL